MWGWRRAQFAQGHVERSNPTPRRKTHCAQGRLTHRKRRKGVGERRSPARVLFRGGCYLGDNEGSARGRGPATGRAFSYRPDCNRVATSSVRDVVIDREPERAEPAAPLSLAINYAAGVVEQPEQCARSSHRVKIAKQVEPLRQVDSMGEEIRDNLLFL